MSLFFFGENRPSVQFFVGRIFLGFIQRGSYPEGIVSAGQFLSSYQTHIMKLSEKKDKSFGLHYEHFTRS